MKTTKGGKVMNPTDAYRKELRKKELKRNKKERKKVREVGLLKKDPDTIREQIQKLEMMKADGALDKARKHKKRQLEDTLNLVLKKRKDTGLSLEVQAFFLEYEEKMREKGEAPVMFSHLGPPRRRTTAEEEERSKHPKPEDSVYYHPTLNPTGAPPPGKPPMYKSSIGPRIPLPTSSSDAASTSKSEMEEATLSVPPPPPPPPPLPALGELTSVDDCAVPASIPLPPPPPAPPKPVVDSKTSLPPPPPPGPPPKDPVAAHTLLPPPPLLQRPSQPLPPGTNESDFDNSKNAASEGLNLKESDRATAVLPPPPPPPPGLLPKSANRPSDATSSESSAFSASGSNDNSKMAPLLPLPPRQPPPMPHRLPFMHPLQADMMPPGVARYPPPPPDMRPPLMVPGVPNGPPPLPGMVPPQIPRPPFAAPPGPPGVPRPSVPSGLPPTQDDDLAALKATPPQKPSYVKSAASTVVKRPLAQHTPELTAMVPASVRVRRETAIPKPKPKPHLSMASSSARSSAPPAIGKSETVASSSAPKAQSIDDSYMAFLEDMKALGALDG